MFITIIEEKSQTGSGISECYRRQKNPMTSFVYRLLYAMELVYPKATTAIHNQISGDSNSHKLFYNLYWLFQATTKRHKTGSYS